MRGSVRVLVFTALAVTLFGLALVLLGIWLWIRSRRQRLSADADEPFPTLDPLPPRQPAETVDPYGGVPPPPAPPPPYRDPTHDEVTS